MKALITSDIHAHKYKLFNQNNQRLNNIVDYLKFIFKYANDNDIDEIIIAGDLYNTMSIISTETVNKVIGVFANCFSKYPRIMVNAISGNHDYATKNLLDSPAQSGLQHLDDIFDCFILLDDQGQIEDSSYNLIHFIPYFEYPEHFYTKLQEIKTKEDVKNYLIMHQTAGMDNPMIKQDVDVNDALITRFNLVFNGHIHKGGRITDNFINIGSPLHRDAGDIGKKSGFWILDTEEASADFIDISERYPQIIYKTVGEELTEWESKQYVILQYPIKADTPNEQAVNDNFNLTLRPEELLANFCDESGMSEEYKKYGVNLIK